MSTVQAQNFVQSRQPCQRWSTLIWWFRFISSDRLYWICFAGPQGFICFSFVSVQISCSSTSPQSRADLFLRTWDGSSTRTVSTWLAAAIRASSSWQSIARETFGVRWMNYRALLVRCRARVCRGMSCDGSCLETKILPWWVLSLLNSNAVFTARYFDVHVQNQPLKIYGKTVVLDRSFPYIWFLP